jgi:hypothetical protein
VYNLWRSATLQQQQQHTRAEKFSAEVIAAAICTVVELLW